MTKKRFRTLGISFALVFLMVSTTTFVAADNAQNDFTYSSFDAYCDATVAMIVLEQEVAEPAAPLTEISNFWGVPALEADGSNETVVLDLIKEKLMMFQADVEAQVAAQNPTPVVEEPPVLEPPVLNPPVVDEPIIDEVMEPIMP